MNNIQWKTYLWLNPFWLLIHHNSWQPTLQLWYLQAHLNQVQWVPTFVVSSLDRGEWDFQFLSPRCQMVLGDLDMPNRIPFLEFKQREEQLQRSLQGIPTFLVQWCPQDKPFAHRLYDDGLIEHWWLQIWLQPNFGRVCLQWLMMQ